jgi:hypothetical protein
MQRIGSAVDEPACHRGKIASRWRLQQLNISGRTAYDALPPDDVKGSPC